MSQEQSILDISRNADTAIATGPIVKVTSTGCDVATANTDALLGIAMNTVALGEMCIVRVAGIARV